MSARILAASIFAMAIALVGLVIGLNCMQGAAPLKLLGVLECKSGLTSSDFRVKAGATAVFVLFLALLFGPVVAALESPRGLRRSGRST